MRALAVRAASAMRWRAGQLAGVQLIYFARLLLLAALLAPEDFGLLAIAAIALSVLMQVSDVGMIPALVHRHDATPEQHDAAWTVALTRALLVTGALVVAAPWVAALFKEPRAAPIIQALALRPSIEALASIGIAHLTRELKFRELAFLYLPVAVVDLSVALLLAERFGVWALVAGTLAGSVTLVMLSYVLAPHRPRLRWQWSEALPLVEFGRWVLLMGVATLAGTLITQLAVSRMLGATALGLFFLAVKLAFVPTDAANAVVGAVAFPVFSRLRHDPAAASRYFLSVLTALYLVLLPVFALTFVLAPQLEVVLGARWDDTAPIVQILCLAAVLGIISSVLHQYLMGHGDARGAFRIDALNAVALVLVLVPCLLFWGVHGAAVAWLVGSLATLALAVARIGQLMPGVLQAARPPLFAAVIVALVAASVAGFAARPLDGLSAIAVGASAGVAAGALVLWWLNAALRLQLQDLRVLLRTSND